MRGDLRRAIEFAEQGIRLTHGDPSVGQDILYFSPYLMFAGSRGNCLAYSGRIAEGREQLHHTLRLASERNDFTMMSTVSGWLIYLAHMSGDTLGSVAHARTAVEAAERVGRIQQVNATQWFGLAAGLEGDWSQAASMLERGVSFARENPGLRMTQALVLSYLALAYVHCENPAARATAEQAVALAQEHGTMRYEIDAQLSLARAFLISKNANDHPAVDAALTRAAACVEQSGARAYLPMIIEERATLARLRGDDGAAMRELREAHRLYEEIGATGHAARLAKTPGL
jgi:ATP/maltotriose-dependent transcriptional regulator MalT